MVAVRVHVTPVQKRLGSLGFDHVYVEVDGRARSNVELDSVLVFAHARCTRFFISPEGLSFSVTDPLRYTSCLLINLASCVDVEAPRP